MFPAGTEELFACAFTETMRPVPSTTTAASGMSGMTAPSSSDESSSVSGSGDGWSSADEKTARSPSRFIRLPLDSSVIVSRHPSRRRSGILVEQDRSVALGGVLSKCCQAGVDRVAGLVQLGELAGKAEGPRLAPQLVELACDELEERNQIHRGLDAFASISVVGTEYVASPSLTWLEVSASDPSRGDELVVTTVDRRAQGEAADISNCRRLHTLSPPVVEVDGVSRGLSDAASAKDLGRRPRPS